MKIDIAEEKRYAIGELYKKTKKLISIFTLRCLDFLEDKEFEEKPSFIADVDKVDIFAVKDGKMYKVRIFYNDPSVAYYGNFDDPEYLLTKIEISSIK